MSRSFNPKSFPSKTLQEQLEAAKKGDISAGKIAALEQELKNARAKVSANKIIFHFDNLGKSFSELLKELGMCRGHQYLYLKKTHNVIDIIGG